MKQCILFTLFVCSLLVTNAQTENPRGLYRLQNFTYDSKSDVVTPWFKQYKYCADNGTLQIVVDVDELDKGGTTSFSMYTNDVGAFNYTGNVPNGEDGLGRRIYDSNKKKFTLSWYNSSLNNTNFPLNEFTHEHYSSTKGVSKNISKAFDMLKNNLGKQKDKYHGVWRRRGATFTSDITGKDYTYNTSDSYKIYSDNCCLILNWVKGSFANMSAECELVKYESVSDKVIFENNNSQIVTWLGDDCFSIVYVDKDLSVESEIWDRCGLPEYFQSVFETQVPRNVVPTRNTNHVDITEYQEVIIGTWEVFSYTHPYDSINSTSLTFEKDGSCHGIVKEYNGEGFTEYEYNDKYSVDGSSLTFEKCSFAEFLSRPEVRNGKTEMKPKMNTVNCLLYKNELSDGGIKYTLYLNSPRGASFRLYR